jgi:hypothetical protein
MCRDVVLRGRTIELGETLGGWKMECGGGGQFTSNLGPGWTRIAPCKEEGFQVSKRGSGEKGSCQGELARGNQQGDLT